MEYRNATLADIPGVSALQEKYHISTISEEDKADGFVTTLFTEDQFKELIQKESGLAIALDKDKIVAYAMAASWCYWSAWPLFQHMIEDLPNIKYLGQVLSTEIPTNMVQSVLTRNIEGRKFFRIFMNFQEKK